LQQAASRADQALLAETHAAVRRASAELYREQARELLPPTGFRPYEPSDEHYVRGLSGR
jgi:hypothetical protein